MNDPTARFTDRVGDYVRYRPGYPPAVLDVLRDELGLTPAHVVADVGSGTGLLSRLFLDNGNAVFGVEPNRAMAREAEAAFAGEPRFRPVEGRAEETGLGDGSVDLVVVGQAFHWFRPAESGREFRRILRPPKRLAVVWNLRRVDSTPFLRDYEALLVRFSPDYGDVSARYAVPQALREAFGGEPSPRRFENAQSFDFDGLRGRLLSSSYAPQPGHPSHAPMVAALEEVFGAHARDGRVAFEYDTELYYGNLRS